VLRCLPMTMNLLKARVTAGHLVLDPPARLPEGTEVDVVVVDPGDDLDAAERERLDAALARSWSQARAGQTRPAEELLERLRSRR
jgi:hypothetical protein